MSLIPFGFWAASGAGGGGSAYDLLETTTLTSTSSGVTFSGLGSYSDYANLQIRIVGRASSSNDLRTTFNSDTNSNYASHNLRGIPASGSSAPLAGSYVDAANIATFSAMMPANDGPSNAFSSVIMDILDFQNTSKFKTVRTITGAVFDDYPGVGLFSGLWRNTDAITSIELKQYSTAFLAGSRFSLYGIKGA